MAPRSPNPQSPITDDDDIDLDSIDTLPADDDEPGDDTDLEATPEPEGDETEPEPEGDETEPEPEGDETDATRRVAADSQRNQGRGRGEQRYQRLSNENKELKDKLSGIQQRFDQFVQNQDAARREQQRETPEQRRQRRALLTPEERAAEDIHDSEQRVSGMLSQAQLQIVDATDKSAFEVKVRSDSLYQRYAAKVETELAGLRARGQNAPRESILKYLIGDAALKARDGQGSKTRRQQAQRRVDRQRTRPGDSRDDVRAERRPRGRSLEDRLADTPI